MKRTKKPMTDADVARLLRRPCKRDNARIIQRIDRLQRVHTEAMNETGVRFLTHCAQALMREAR